MLICLFGRFWRLDGSCEGGGGDVTGSVRVRPRAACRVSPALWRPAPAYHAARGNIANHCSRWEHGILYSAMFACYSSLSFANLFFICNTAHFVGRVLNNEPIEWGAEYWLGANVVSWIFTHTLCLALSGSCFVSIHSPYCIVYYTWHLTLNIYTTTPRNANSILFITITAPTTVS